MTNQIYYNSDIIPNKINRQYTTNHNIWSVDETFFNKSQVLFLVVNNKTRAIIGFIYKRSSNEGNPRGKSIYCTAEDILYLYKQLIDQKRSPEIIHSDTNPTYVATIIQQFCQNKGIELSTTATEPRHNQLVEGVNHAVKANLVFILAQVKRPHKYRDWHNAHYKDNKKLKKASSRGYDINYRKDLFTSEMFFELKNIETYILLAIQLYNQNLPNENKLKFRKISRGDFEYYNTFIYVSDLKKAKESSEISAFIKQDNAQAAIDVKHMHDVINDSDEIKTELKVEMIENIVVPQVQGSFTNCVNQLEKYVNPGNQDIINTLKLLARQSAENTNLVLQKSEALKKEIAELKNKNNSLLQINEESRKILQELKDYKRTIEEQERKRLELKIKRQERKRRQENDPILEDDYKIIINFIEHHYNGSELKKSRFRILSTLLFLTGGRISEILEFDFNQIFILINKHYLQFSRKKGGPTNKKAYIATKKRYILKDRIFDLQYLIQSRGIPFNFSTHNVKDFINSPQLDIFIFATNNSNKPLSRSTTTHEFNLLLKSIPEFKETGRRITSHSFRHGFIYKYWRSTKDLELVRQIIGHCDIGSTQRYVKALSQGELQKRIELADDD